MSERFAECHPDRKFCAKGMCRTCYERSRRPGRRYLHPKQQVPRSPTLPPLSERIHDRIDSSGGPNACHLWTGSVGQREQPTLYFPGPGNKCSVRRVIYAAAHGPIPPKRWVTTSCKTKRCLNPGHLMLRAVKDDVARFWEHVSKGDGCWTWIGNRTKRNYGVFNRCTPAHRKSYEITRNVKLLPGQVVMHKCDNPPCVRPDHLSIGTVLDNNRDAIAKGRHSHGEKHAEIMRAARARARKTG